MPQPTKQYAQEIFTLLKDHYPHAKMILNWDNNWELLVAVILSAQSTDIGVNKVTEKLFPKYRKANPELKKHYDNYRHVILSTSEESHPMLERKAEILRRASLAQDDKLDENKFIELVNFAQGDIHELEKDIYSTGFYRAKAKSLQAAAKVILEKFHGEVPKTMAGMITIPGAARKTANVVLGNAYHVYEGIAVDTHVRKQAQLLGLTKNTDPNKIEQDLMKLFPKDQWFQLTYLLIEHGRATARGKYPTCTLHKNCPLFAHVKRS